MQRLILCMKKDRGGTTSYLEVFVIPIAIQLFPNLW